MSLDSLSGAGIPGRAGDIPFSDTLGSVGKTLGAACGVDRALLDQNIRRGKLVAGALAPV